MRSIPDPEVLAPHDVLVDVEVAGLCGSDLHPFFGREQGIDPGTAMGHEFVGRVSEVGSAVESFAVGDRVGCPFTTNCGKCFYCLRGLSSRCTSGQLFGWREAGLGLHGGQAERVRVPLADGTLFHLGDSLSSDVGLLLGDNLTTGYFAASMAVEAETVAADVFVVVGCGTVGLLAIAALKRLGAKTIFAVDPNEARLGIAASSGAVGFVDADQAREVVARETEGRGADGVVELVGLPQAQRLAYDLIRPGGRMSVIGCHCTPGFAFSPAEAYDKNLSYRTGRCPARSLVPEVQRWLAEEPLDLSWCVTHRFALSDGVEAYDTFAHRKDGCVKAVLEV